MSVGIVGVFSVLIKTLVLLEVEEISLKHKQMHILNKMNLFEKKDKLGTLDSVCSISLFRTMIKPI